MYDMAYAYWLQNLSGVGDKTILKLLKIHKKAERIYERLCGSKEVPKEYERVLTRKQFERAREHMRSWNVREEYEKLCQSGISFVSLDSNGYPARLRNTADPPYGIYYKGILPREDILSVAVIGARECSEYGRFVGKELGKTLGKNGVQVISGMARGIDGISQEAALEAGGTSFGVLGCGVDVCYPESNRRLYDRLIAGGGILSSYRPGILPKSQLFPPRNRIVSGLSDAVIVVEARQKSGTLITVDMALEQGREVYVVPGRLTDRLSDGCNRLIKQGAGIILSPEEFIGEMSQLFPEKLKKQSVFREISDKEMPGTPALKEVLEKRVYSGLDLYPRSVEQIREAAGLELSYPEMQRILMKLCMTPYVRQVGTGFYEKNASATGF